jgi:AcrR family transcriptional regulator
VLPLDKTLTGRSPKNRNARIFDRHHGLDGKGGANFQRIGQEVGLTRERVRQIVSEFDARGYITAEALAALDAVIAAIVAELPASTAVIERKLQAEGMTLKPFRLEGIVNAASLVGRPVPFQVRNCNRKRFAVAPGYPRFADILTRARRRVRRCGMAAITACIAGKTKMPGARRDASLVEAILSAQSDFRWLDRASGWFWFTDTTRNRAVSRVRKMLAVANPLTMSEISAALARMKSPLPPRETLIEFCRQVPGLVVEGGAVSADPTIKIDDVLNKTEQNIFRLLSDHDGCMSNSELILGSRAMGVKRPTFYQCVTNSPIVARYNQDQYRLIGTPSFRVAGAEIATA